MGNEKYKKNLEKSRDDSLAAAGSIRPGISHANRGAALENLVKHAAAHYRAKGIGVIEKIPTPLRQSSARNGATPNFWREKSTVDYVGVLAGYAIAFDCKETRTARFPMREIKPHQRDFLADFDKAAGIAFVLVEFVTKGKIFAATLGWLDKAAAELNDAKSIPFMAFCEADGDAGIAQIPEYAAGQPLPFALAIDAVRLERFEQGLAQTRRNQRGK